MSKFIVSFFKFLVIFYSFSINEFPILIAIVISSQRLDFNLNFYRFYRLLVDFQDCFGNEAIKTHFGNGLFKSCWKETNKNLAKKMKCTESAVQSINLIYLLCFDGFGRFRCDKDKK